MKRIIICCGVVVALTVAYTSTHFHTEHNEQRLSSLSLANVEALSNDTETGYKYVTRRIFENGREGYVCTGSGHLECYLP